MKLLLCLFINYPFQDVSLTVAGWTFQYLITHTQVWMEHLPIYKAQELLQPERTVVREDCKR